MGLWKTVRREVAGAWRSARYDVHRRSGMHRATKLRHAETHEMQLRQVNWRPAEIRQHAGAKHRPSPARRAGAPWAGRPIPALPGNPAHPPIQARPGGLTPVFEDAPRRDDIPRRQDAPRRPDAPRIAVKAPNRRRKALATSGVALLVAGGAAGTYLAITAGLHAESAGTETPAPRVAAPRAAAMPDSIDTPKVKATRGHAAAGRVPRQEAQAPYEVAPDGVVDVPAPEPTHGPEQTPAPSPSPSASPSDDPSPSASASSPSSPPPSFTGRHHRRHAGESREGH